MNNDRFIGLISGTSVDGIDAALVEFREDRPFLLQHHLHPYPESVKTALLDLFTPGQNEIDRLGTLDATLGLLFAEAAVTLLTKSGLSAGQIRAIGSHGQTIRHRPSLAPPFTLQIGDPGRIAEQTRIPVVADFRRRDMAAGGQGAPLAPAFHQAFMSSTDESRVVLNLGGIANITLLPVDGRSPLAFDTGPANGLMDAWIHRHRGLPFDPEGNWAASGNACPELLSRLLDEAYFRQSPPKSTGKELFHLTWAEQQADLSRWDATAVQATFLALSVHSIADAIRAVGGCDRVLVCGGGVHNRALMAQLEARLGIPVESTACIGIDPDWVEAMAFAWLARCHLRGEALDLRLFTGSTRPVILGCLVPGP